MSPITATRERSRAAQGAHADAMAAQARAARAYSAARAMLDHAETQHSNQQIDREAVESYREHEASARRIRDRAGALLDAAAARAGIR